MKRLVTKRLILRPLRLTDLAAFYAYAKKPNIGPMAGWAPHRSPAESLKILKMMIAEEEVWGITIKPNDEIVGTIGLHERNLAHMIHRAKEIGYALDDLYWGQGLVPEAVNEVLKYGFESQNLATIICGHSGENHQSRRVIDKTGFIYSHHEIRQDHQNEDMIVYVYKMTNEDYEKRRQDDKTID